jgi:hypothetical protein
MSMTELEHHIINSLENLQKEYCLAMKKQNVRVKNLETCQKYQ